MPPSGCTAAGLLQTGRRPAYAARVCKAVHTLAALLRRRSPAPIRSAYAARIRCSSPATAAMAKSRSRLSRCSFTDCALYDLAGPPPAVLELISIEKCIHVSTGTAGVMRAGTVCRVRAVEKSFVGQRTRPRARLARSTAWATYFFFDGLPNISCAQSACAHLRLYTRGPIIE